MCVVKLTSQVSRKKKEKAIFKLCCKYAAYIMCRTY